MTTLATRPQNGGGAMTADAVEEVLVGGDLSKLSAEQRVAYYRRTCESLGLNWLTKPFDYIRLNNKLTLYAKKDATDQLRALRKVSIEIVAREHVGDIYVVTARATLPEGRRDEEVGAVSVKSLQGEALANALMKASTKAKRRVTLSICGLGWLDETEIETIRDAERVTVQATGEIVDTPAATNGKAPADPIAKLRTRYAALEREAKSLEVPVHPIPEDATEEQITDLGLDLKNRIDEAKTAKGAARWHRPRTGRPTSSRSASSRR